MRASFALACYSSFCQYEMIEEGLVSLKIIKKRGES
jgi:hypothetical protein